MSQENPLEEAMRVTGVTRDEARVIIGAALRQLHRVAVTSEFGTEAVVQECYFSLGGEACYHLGGILEADRTVMSHDTPWTEFFIRFAPDLIEEFGPFGSTWQDERSPQRKQLDDELNESGRW
jgi:hypothetical protein